MKEKLKRKTVYVTLLFAWRKDLSREKLLCSFTHHSPKGSAPSHNYSVEKTRPGRLFRNAGRATQTHAFHPYGMVAPETMESSLVSARLMNLGSGVHYLDGWVTVCLEDRVLSFHAKAAAPRTTEEAFHITTNRISPP